MPISGDYAVRGCRVERRGRRILGEVLFRARTCAVCSYCSVCRGESAGPWHSVSCGWTKHPPLRPEGEDKSCCARGSILFERCSGVLMGRAPSPSLPIALCYSSQKESFMARQIVFRYNGDTNTEEVEQDLDDSILLPARDSVYRRKGKSWRVAALQTTGSLDSRGPIPIVTIFLTDK